MKSIIIYLLVFSTFSAPMAWAFDIHARALGEHTHVVPDTWNEHDGDAAHGIDSYRADINGIDIVIDTESYHNNNHDPEQADHCDHGIAHLTSLVSSASLSMNPNFKTLTRNWNDTFTTVALNPPYKPPIG